MSEATAVWTKKLHCVTGSHPSKALFFVASSVMCCLPIVFYIICYVNGKRTEDENMLVANYDDDEIGMLNCRNFL